MQLLPQVEGLIKAGAPAVVVVNLYPVNLAPVTTYFLCKEPYGSQCAQNWGTVIEAANAKLETSLSSSQYADKIIYYDVYGFMMNVMAQKNKYGFTAPLSEYCACAPKAEEDLPRPPLTVSLIWNR